jgi:DNA helicase II / ATP-dependent DNA helicase PcrA
MPSRQISVAYLEAAEQLRGNAEQWAAYESAHHCVMLAGPGSGKTKTLILKLARVLVEDVQAPRGVACITYSQETARELVRRLGDLGLRESSRLFIGTIHSFCLLNLLIPYAKLAQLQIPLPIKVAPVGEADRIFTRASEAMFGLRNPWRKHHIDAIRRCHLDRDNAAWRDAGDDARLADAYVAALRAEGYLDFEDLVHFGQRLVLENDWVLPIIRARFPVLAVDEYQDLGVGLHRIVQRLAFDGGVRLVAVGDVDQSIYGFNGANSELLSRLAARPDVERVRLQVNYRSANDIIRMAERALGQDRNYRAVDENRQARIEICHCSEGLAEQAYAAMTTIIPDALAAKGGRQLGDVAILYRTAEIGNLVAQAATDAGYSFIRIDNAAPYKKTPVTSWVEDCARWCSGGWQVAAPRLKDLLGKWFSFRRSRLTRLEEQNERVKVTKFLWDHRGVWQATDFLREMREELLDDLLTSQPQLADQAASVAAMTRALGTGGALAGITTLRLAGRDGSPDQLNLLTLHSAKGTEYDVVIMVGLDQGSFPWRNESGEQLAESRRLFYVGITRAKDEVYILYSGFTERNGQRYRNGPSIFLEGLLNED